MILASNRTLSWSRLEIPSASAFTAWTVPHSRRLPYKSRAETRALTSSFIDPSSLVPRSCAKAFASSAVKFSSSPRTSSSTDRIKSQSTLLVSLTRDTSSRRKLKKRESRSSRFCDKTCWTDVSPLSSSCAANTMSRNNFWWRSSIEVADEVTSSRKLSM